MKDAEGIREGLNEEDNYDLEKGYIAIAKLIKISDKSDDVKVRLAKKFREAIELIDEDFNFWDFGDEADIFAKD